MKSLFLKTFIWFWVTTIVTISATYLISSQLLDNPRHSHDLDELVEHYFDESQEKLNDDGIVKFNQWLEHRRLPRGVGILLLDQNNSVIAKKRIPRPILEYYLDNKKWPEPGGIKLNMKQHIVETSSGQLQLFALWLPKKTEFGNPNHSPWFKQFSKRTPGWGAFRLFIALLISGVICYLLARYISKPIIKLRGAVNDLQQGKFDTNVAGEFKNRNDEIAELAADFDQMSTELKNQFKQREDLLRDISHELRSPLARMRIASELIKSRLNNNNLSEINRIELEISRLDELIGEIIDFSKLKNTNQNLSLSQFDLSELLQLIISDANFEGKTGNKKIEFHPADLNNIEINANKTLISRAIENVIRNALKYTTDNTNVIVTIRQENRSAIITIHDQGPGIPENQLDMIFEPFFRVSESRRRESGGTGLGLAISKRAIELHNGEIHAINDHQCGLVITIQLPLLS